MDEIEEAEDALQQYEAIAISRRNQPGYVTVWAPRMSEEDRAAFEQHIKDNALPF